MSAYVVSVARDVSQGARLKTAAKCPRRRRRNLLHSDDSWCGRGLQGCTIVQSPVRRGASVALEIRCDDSDGMELPSLVSPPREQDWMDALKPGCVIEVWSQGELRFGLVSELYEKGAVASFVEVSSDAKKLGTNAKVSYGEIIGIWDEALQPQGSGSAAQLVRDVEAGLRLLKVSLPRRLDLGSAYDDMRRVPKNDPRGVRNATEVAKWVFPMRTAGTRDRNATITVATAILLAADTIRFKRAGPGKGWRALPASVAFARGRCSFVDMCKRILDQRASGSVKRAPMWSRDHLEILRELEIYAASASGAKGRAATALEALGYEPTDDGAARMLLDIEYWATGTVEKHGGGKTQSNEASNGTSIAASWIDSRYAEISDQEKLRAKVRKSRAGQNGNDVAQTIRDWTFPPEILAEARELRETVRERRSKFLKRRFNSTNLGRRNLLQSHDGHPLRVYCIDDKASRFLDDALSVQVLEDGAVIRVAVHIADVDQVVKSGSAIDELARERGQSLYLPLKPLHMLPAAAMEAASFSSSFPTEAITVLMDFDVINEVISNWEVFSSVVPPVTRLNYDQFDAALEDGAAAAQITEEDCHNLRHLARTAPLLAERLDQRRLRRKQKPGGVRLDNSSNFDDEVPESRGIASVRLVKRNEKGSRKTVKVAQVVDFRTTGSHTAVGGMLTSASALIRQFAKENRAHLPEDRGASWYVSRCGTAPLRRYADLAIQRQVKCVLFGRQPAGRRRMDELRVWLAKRQSAGERAVAERRRFALYDSLSNHCSQQCSAAGSKHAWMPGQVRNVSLTRSGRLKVDVTLDGTGLATAAEISPTLIERMQTNGGAPDSGANCVDFGSLGRSNNNTCARQNALSQARLLLRPKSKVQVQVESVDTVARRIQATIVDLL